MRQLPVAIAILTAALCSACASDTGRFETSSVINKKLARPVAAKKAAVTPVALKSDANTPSNDADKAGYCGRWWKHRANNTLPTNVASGSSDVAHGDSYCASFR